MTFEIEIDGPANECLRFRPLQRSVRGRFDWARCGEPEALRQAVQWGNLPVPGQRIGFDDATGTGYVSEPLHDSQFAALAEKIKARGLKLAAERETFSGADRNTWLWWMRAAVLAGLARLVSGAFPEDIDDSRVRKDFVFAPRQPTTNDRLAEALAAQAAAIAQLAAAVADIRQSLAGKGK